MWQLITFIDKVDIQHLCLTNNALTGGFHDIDELLETLMQNQCFLWHSLWWCCYCQVSTFQSQFYLSIKIQYSFWWFWQSRFFFSFQQTKDSKGKTIGIDGATFVKRLVMTSNSFTATRSKIWVFLYVFICLLHIILPYFFSSFLAQYSPIDNLAS
jgi:hypothetical protein